MTDYLALAREAVPCQSGTPNEPGCQCENCEAVPAVTAAIERAVREDRAQWTGQACIDADNARLRAKVERLSRFIRDLNTLRDWPLSMAECLNNALAALEAPDAE